VVAFLRQLATGGPLSATDISLEIRSGMGHLVGAV
jgi:hypothetical protein